jgi:hypothetical protein
MRDKLQVLGQQRHQNVVDFARDGHALERAVGGDDVIKDTGIALLDEFLAGPGFGLDDIGQGGDLGPFLVGTGEGGGGYQLALKKRGEG